MWKTWHWRKSRSGRCQYCFMFLWRLLTLWRLIPENVLTVVHIMHFTKRSWHCGHGMLQSAAVRDFLRKLNFPVKECLSRHFHYADSMGPKKIGTRTHVFIYEQAILISDDAYATHWSRRAASNHCSVLRSGMPHFRIAAAMTPHIRASKISTFTRWNLAHHVDKYWFHGIGRPF